MTYAIQDPAAAMCDGPALLGPVPAARIPGPVRDRPTRRATAPVDVEGAYAMTHN